jgi:hypothetical protein
MTLPSSNPERTLDSCSLDRSVATRAWAYGWAISRGTKPPIERCGYFQILVGRPEQTTRYVLSHLEPELLHELVSTETGPGSWLKVCAPIESVSPLLSVHWNVHEPEFLMSANLAGGHPPVIDGYRLHAGSAGAIASAKLIADTGEMAASGQVAIDGLFATFDQIVTAESHRRKGLGRHIMTALSNISLDLGARQGVLVATEAGAALYKAIGWSMVSPVTAASFSRVQGVIGGKPPRTSNSVLPAAPACGACSHTAAGPPARARRRASPWSRSE